MTEERAARSPKGLFDLLVIVLLGSLVGACTRGQALTTAAKTAMEATGTLQARRGRIRGWIVMYEGSVLKAILARRGYADEWKRESE
jgi:hypothetical protein